MKLIRRDDTSANVHKTAILPSIVERSRAVAPGDPSNPGNGIDFHAPEFNSRDDLDDLSGNYRIFEPLGGIITADMRHQAERREQTTHADASGSRPISTKNEPVQEDTARAGDGSYLTLTSRGRILIVDTDPARAVTWGKNLQAGGLTCTLIITGGKSSGPSWSGGIHLLQIPSLSVTGFLGHFSAGASGNGGLEPLSKWLDAEASVFDLVLDLQPRPSFAGCYLPPGYYTCGLGPDEAQELQAELILMRGRFQKPQFTTFRQDRCLASRYRKSDCRRCLEVCPLSAIEFPQGKPAFNHSLCQGCGACVLVCPAEAIELNSPSLADRLNDLEQALAYRPAGVTAPILVIGDGDADRSSLSAAGPAKDGCILFPVDRIGYAGVELLLAALLLGAGKVSVVCDPQNDVKVIDAVRQQVQLGRAILKGLGQPEDLFCFRILTDAEQPETKSTADTTKRIQLKTPTSPPDFFPHPRDRRTLIRLAVEKLCETLDAPRTLLPLPEGSPFGAITIDPACTLCMACVEACPANALRAGGGIGKIEFREADCCQCGLCKELCPEKAVQLQPRLLCSSEQVNDFRVLQEVQTARCVECGKPFASQSMIVRMQTKLSGHWMYASEKQLRRLQMCRVCRTRDALMAEDLKQWNAFQAR